MLAAGGRLSQETPVGNQCCSIHHLTQYHGCYGYYNLEDGIPHGGLRVFKISPDNLEIQQLAGEWRCRDAGIYEFQVVPISELRWDLFAIDTKSRIWLIELTQCVSNPNDFQFLEKDVHFITEEKGQVQGTCIRTNRDANLLSGVTMSGDLGVADLRSFDVLFYKEKAHHQEILSTAILSEQRLVATGSEDMQVRFWDVRIDPGSEAVLKIAKCHNAGVTAISSILSDQYEAMPDYTFHENSNYLLTGSYDDKVRLFDLRFLAEPVDVIETGGGVWDFVWSSQFPGNFLVPNCFSGLKRGFLSDLGGYSSSWRRNSGDITSIDSWSQTGLALSDQTCVHMIDLIRQPSTNEHSLYYAADWFHEGRIAVTSSFYDRSLIALTIAG